MGGCGYDRALANAFRRRALAAGLVSGALALAGLLVMRHSGLDLTHGAALALVCVSAAAGLSTLLLCWRYRFELARVTAALAVAAVVVGWAAGQAPRFLPGLTVVQAAAGRSTLVALVIAVACGAVVLVPSLALLFSLYLRGRLYTPEHPAPGDAVPGMPCRCWRLPFPRKGRKGRKGWWGQRGREKRAGAGRSGRGRGSGRRPRGVLDGARLGRGGGDGAGGGAGLLVFADASWAHLLGVACLVLCAVSVFRLSATD